MKTFLHVGCGPKRQNQTTVGFNTSEWHELTFDIDASLDVDIVGDMTDMSGVDDSSVDAVFSSHNIEHLYPHDVPIALKEFLRVLKPDGFLVVTCPDLQSVCAMVANNQLTEELYSSSHGSISAMDILYGHRLSIEHGNTFMAHRCGFTKHYLMHALLRSGFENVIATRRESPCFDLWAVATKSYVDGDVLYKLAEEHFPVYDLGEENY